MDPTVFFQGLAVWTLPILLAITLHEAAHAVAADYLGDPTSRMLGRVSLNPVKHVDPVGTLLVPALLLLSQAPFLFGWAKPVPVSFRNLKNPKRDMMLVALAGPIANLLIAFACALLVHLMPYVPGFMNEWLFENLRNAIFINIILALFNMLPIPPLDGGRVLTGLLPDPLAYKFAQIERYGFFIVLGLIFLIPALTGSGGNPIDPVRDYIQWGLGTFLEVIMSLAGHDLSGAS